MTGKKWRWPPGLRQTILNRDRHCQIQLPNCKHTGPKCRGDCAEQVDHINPNGMHYDPNNLRAACRNCNNKRRTHHTPTPTPHPPEHW